MDLPFSKYSGAGNDFIAVDDRAGSFPLHDKALIQLLCHRQYGIGADGLLFLQTSNHADARMRIHNADGSEAEMCGNGLRCFARFLIEKGFPQRCLDVETQAGVFPVAFAQQLVRTFFPPPNVVSPASSLSLLGSSHAFMHLNTGVPHAVAFVATMKELQMLPLSTLGPAVRHHPSFAPHGTNVNFAFFCPQQEKIFLRTYERGVEQETLACGTGAVATALAAQILYALPSPIEVKVASQESLHVSFCATTSNSWQDVSLLGPAKKIFCGVYSLSVAC